MIKDKYKQQFALAATRAFRAVYADRFAQAGEVEVFNEDTVYERIETPKDPRMGRFSLPVFRYGKLLGDAPQSISERVVVAANEILADQAEESLVKCNSVKGFINVEVEFRTLCRETLTEALTKENAYGESDYGKNRKYLVEYSSPNIAKPFGIGHLRSTVIGNSLRLINKKLGFDTLGINYPGDWGTQFGKMIVAYRKWGEDVDLEAGDIKDLLELYVRFHEEADNDDSLNDQARLAFKELESGDRAAVELWERFKTVSHAEFDRVYSRLGVEFDLVIGEAFLNDKMGPVIERLEKAGLTSVSQGALVVALDDPNLPPCLLKKADGATLYSTRDLAGLIYRWNSYRFYESLYVVGSAQADHFRQALMVIDMLEQAENLPPEDRMTGRVKHVEFGWVKFDNRTMSTRRGEIIFLEDVIDRAVALAKEKIKEKNPDLAAMDATAEMIGVGAVLFSQLSVRRQKDVSFIWEDVLNFEGETGPYLQYTHARLCSLLRNFSGTFAGEIDYALLDREEEKRVVELLADFPETVFFAASHYDPYFIAAYLLRLAGAFNKVYQRKGADGRIDKIISEDESLTRARVALVRAVQLVVNEGLRLLGMQAPEEM